MRERIAPEVVGFNKAAGSFNDPLRYLTKRTKGAVEEHRNYGTRTSETRQETSRCRDCNAASAELFAQRRLPHPKSAFPFPFHRRTNNLQKIYRLTPTNDYKCIRFLFIDSIFSRAGGSQRPLPLVEFLLGTWVGISSQFEICFGGLSPF